MVFWTGSFFEWVDGEYIYVWSETVWVFSSQEASWVSMKFGGRRFKVMKHLGILVEFHNVFLLEFSVSLLAIFLGFF